MKTRQQPSQRGFTLIELMISMAIGLLVAIAAVQLFVTALSSFNLQRGLSDVNENGRFGLDYIVRNVRVGQYSKSSLASDPTDSAVVMTAAQLPGSPAGGFSTNTDSGTLGITSGDQLVVRRWVPASTTNERDCEGNIINAGADGVYAVSRYFLKADGTNSASALFCDAGTYAPTATSVTGYVSGTAGAGIVLLSAVDSFQVLYGVSAAVGSTVPVRYVTSTQYLTLVPQPPIVAIRLGVLVRSSDGVGNLAVASPALNLLGVDITTSAQDAANAKIVRRVFINTVALRNVL